MNSLEDVYVELTNLGTQCEELRRSKYILQKQIDRLDQISAALDDVRQSLTDAIDDVRGGFKNAPAIDHLDSSEG